MAQTLHTLAPGIHYLAGGVNVLVLEDGHGGALIVDSGLDADHGKKIVKALKEKDLEPRAILNTHSHADHFGGNAFLESKFPEIKVFAPPLEEAILRYPILEPIYLFGARPPKVLQNKFLMAPASNARLAPEPGLCKIVGVSLELLEVAGHASMMYAVRVGSFLYAADVLFGVEVLQKHPMSFCVDSRLQKESVQKLGTLDGIETVLCGHGNPTSDLAALVQVNLEVLETTTQAVKVACVPPASIDTILQRVCQTFGMEMQQPTHVLLNRSAVSAHLTELLERGEIEMRVNDNLLEFGVF